MKLWQAAWDRCGELVIWGVDASKANSFSTSNNTSFGSTHPFSCSIEELRASCNALDIEPDFDKTISVLLPSDIYGPLFPPSLPTSQPREIAEPVILQTWDIPAVTFSSKYVLSLLTDLPLNETNDVKFDDSLLFWFESTKLCLELLTRGRFLPGLIKGNTSFVSRWHLIATEEGGSKKFEALHTAMPDVCRGLIQKDSEIFSSEELLESFITTVGDAAIRLFLKNCDLRSDVSSLRLTQKLQTVQSWLGSLTAEEPLVEAPEFELQALENKLTSWAGNFLKDFEEHNIRTYVQLVPPKQKESSEEHPWLLEFGIQSQRDHTKMLDAQSLWNGDLKFLKSSNFSSEQLQCYLLKDLGKISDFIPAIERALASNDPHCAALSTSEVYEFIKTAPTNLEALGIHLLMPSWWNNAETRVGLKLKVSSSSSSSSSGILGAKQLLNYDWEVAVGDTSFSLDEFRLLVNQKSPLVLVNDRWIEFKPEQVNATLKFLESKKSSSSTLTTLEALKLGLGVTDTEDVFPVIDFSAEGWINALLRTNDFTFEQINQPENFHGELRPYQKEGLSWLHFLSTVSLGSCLADDMGLGKTIQFLALLLHEKKQAIQNGSPILPTLLVVPMSILDNWEREARKFTPELNTFVHHGPTRQQINDFKAAVPNHDLIITTYNLVYRDEALFNAVTWGRIALDEAQNIKNLNTKQTRAVRNLSLKQAADTTRAIPIKRIALTGTPLENRLDELWSIFDFLNPGYLGTLSEFRTKFSIPIERFRNREASETLAKAVRPFILRRLKTDSKVISDLPEKIEMEETTGLTPEQAALYQKTVNELLPEVDKATGIHRKGLVLASITKLKQICNHPALYLKDNNLLEERSGKLMRLCEIVDTLIAEGDRILIFTQYAQMGHLLKDFLQEKFKQEVLFLHGALTRKARDVVLEKFQSENGPQIFILSLKAGGFGLNLTRANQVIHYDQWWNPAVQDQATDRAFRIGQKVNVQVRTFMCKGTLEEKIAELLKSKKNLADEIVGSTKNYLTELSTDELRDLLSLSVNALRDFSE